MKTRCGKQKNTGIIIIKSSNFKLFLLEPKTSQTLLLLTNEALIVNIHSKNF